MDRTDEALIDYSKAIEINPQNVFAYNNRGRYNLENKLGDIEKDLGRKEDALIDYSKAIEINPLNA